MLTEIYANLVVINLLQPKLLDIEKYFTEEIQQGLTINTQSVG